MKECKKCKLVKNFDNFGFSNHTKDGYYRLCKECVKIDNSNRRKPTEYGVRWKQSLLLGGEKYCNRCKKIKPINNFRIIKGRYQSYCNECKSKCDKEYREKLKTAGVYKERKRLEYQKNYDKRRKNMLDYNKNRRNYKKEYQTTLNLWKKNPIAKIRNSIRNRFLVFIKNSKFKTNLKSIELFGADWDTIRLHLEGLFLTGMNWENHGKGPQKWHIDHKIPLSSAKTEAELIKLFQYKNLQPMWGVENLKKGSKLSY